MSIASKLEKLATDITSAYGAINTKGGTIPSNKNTENLANAITSIPQGGGGGSVEEKDVNFYDYDGTLTNSYTKAEFLALTELPENPTHAGLTAQGWNWTLSDAKTHVTTYTKLDIGQMYITDDGKTRIYITLTNDDLVGLNLGICVNGSVTVDWGDETSETITGSSIDNLISTPHTYSQAGDYIIKITCSTGNSFNFYGLSNSSIGSTTTKCFGSYILFNTNVNSLTNYTTIMPNIKAIKKIELGSGIDKINSAAFYNLQNMNAIILHNNIASISTQAFYGCGNLNFVVIPNSVTTLESYVFTICCSIKKIILPNNITFSNSGSQQFAYCYNLESIIMAGNFTKIPNYCFNNCLNLKYVILPNGITTIGTYAFLGCKNLKTINVSNATNIETNGFYNCNYLKIDIPSNLATVGNAVFCGCYNAEFTIMPTTLTNITARLFESCYMTNFDFSNYTTIPTLANTSAFSQTTGTIIVPDSLYNDWIAATNWSSLASRIVKASEV